MEIVQLLQGSSSAYDEEEFRIRKVPKIKWPRGKVDIPRKQR